MKRFLLLSLFVGLMADSMFGWGLGLAPGVSLKNAMLYLLVLIIAIEIAVSGGKAVIELPQIHLLFSLLFFVAFLSWMANTFIGLYVDYSSFEHAIALKGSLLDHYLFFLVFFLGVRSEEDVLWLQKWILVVIAVGNILTVMDAYNLPDLNVIETRHGGRVQGPLGEANQYGLFVAMFLPILLARAWIERGLWRKFFAFGSAATFLVLLMTVSRGAMVALLLGSLFSAVFLREHMNARYIKRFLGVGVVAVLAATVVLGQEYANLIAERMSGTASAGGAYELTSGRTWIWATGLGIMMSEPWSILIGYGWNTFRSVVGIAPHNVYMGYFFGIGVIGLLIFIGLLFTILFWARRSVNTNTSGSILIPAQIGFVFGFSILMIGIFAVDLANPWYFIWAYAGLAMRGGTILLQESRSIGSSSSARSRQGVVEERLSGERHEPGYRPGSGATSTQP